MSIDRLQIHGYRSLREIDLRVGRLAVFVGPNGCGKSNLYRAMRLLVAAAEGGLARRLALEGGMPSVLWAGSRRRGSVRLRIAAEFENWRYELSLGLPTPTQAAFETDPMVKKEMVGWSAKRTGKKVELLKRDHGTAWVRDSEGARVVYPMALADTEAALSQIHEPDRYPELSMLRSRIRGWRFYHDFRTDEDSPIRAPQVAAATPMLGADGRDLAAAMHSIREFGDPEDFDDAIEDAFPGTRVEIEFDRARCALVLRTPGMQRPMRAEELSDGTLRYLCLMAALHATRPPSVLALNEPENSIHPDLFEPLARAIAKAAQRSQLWIITHSAALTEALERYGGQSAIRLDRASNGETLVTNARDLEAG